MAEREGEASEVRRLADKLSNALDFRRYKEACHYMILLAEAAEQSALDTVKVLREIPLEPERDQLRTQVRELFSLRENWYKSANMMKVLAAKLEKGEE